MITIKNMYTSPQMVRLALIGMRNPMNSWERGVDTYVNEDFINICKNDIKLMRQLCKAGPEHRKYLRQIPIVLTINAPLYWWKEFDTYKIGTTANSCSTMHKLMSKPITMDDFSFDGIGNNHKVFLQMIVDRCESIRIGYVNETNDERKKELFRLLIQTMPCGYNQERTVTMNYENVLNMIHQRKNHKLSEWRTLVDIFKDQLPIVELLTMSDENFNGMLENMPGKHSVIRVNCKIKESVLNNKKEMEEN